MCISRIAILILAAALTETGAIGVANATGNDANATDATANTATGFIWEPHDHTLFHNVPDWWLTTAATWGNEQADGLTNKAWMWRQCPTDTERLSTCVESDIGINYYTISHGKHCFSGWLFKGLSKTPLECARECYSTFGCETFSLNSYGECRVSVGIDHSPLQKEPAADMQCEVAEGPGDADVMLYHLAFYHATHAGAYCKNFYKLVEGINTTAQCAHACKNTDTCRSFSVGSGRVDGGCVYGCRISDCHENTEGSVGSGCRSQNSQCELRDPVETRDLAGSCYHYELDDPKSIPAPTNR